MVAGPLELDSRCPGPAKQHETHRARVLPNFAVSRPSFSIGQKLPQPVNRGE